MQRALCIFLFLGAALSWARANSLSTSELMALLPEAMTGVWKSPAILTELKRTTVAGTPTNRILAAYLLSFAEGYLPHALILEESRFLVSQKDSQRILGNQAWDRLLRIVGDDAFQEGNFNAASEDFSRLAQSTKKDLRDYALLKLGWCKMNTRDPHAAFALWSAHLKKRTSRSASDTPFLQGLGQAYTEDHARTREENATLIALPLHSDEIQNLIEGMVEGTLSLHGEADFSQLALSVRDLPWHAQFTEALLKGGSYANEGACDALLLIEPTDAVFSLSHPLNDMLQSCLTSQEGKDLSSAGASRIARWLDATSPSAESYANRFALALKVGKASQACLEGFHALLTALDVSLDLTSLSSQCNQALEANANFAPSQLLPLLESREGLPHLSHAKDPVTFTLVSLFKSRSFFDVLQNRVLSAPALYQSTLIPSLLAENALTHHDLKESARLLGSFSHKPNESSQEERPIWRQVVLNQVDTALSSHHPQDAKTLLQRYFPIAATPLDSVVAKAWLADLSHLPISQWELAPLKTLHTLAQSQTLTEAGDSRAALTSLLEKAEDWPDMWILLDREFTELGSQERDSLESTLLHALSQKRFTPSAFTHPELRLISNAAALLAAGQLSQFTSLKVASNSHVGADLKVVVALAKESDRLFSSRMGHKPPLSQISDRLRFLQKEGQVIERHRWTSQELANSADALLVTFCQHTQAALPLTPPDGVEASQWQEMTTQITARLTQCKASAPATQEAKL